MKKVSLLIIIFLISGIHLLAKDTDIYRQNVKPNVMILVDTSGSMGWGVYEHTIDYGAFYDWASELGDCDVIAGGCGTNNAFYHNHFPKNEILLIKGNIGVTIKNGKTFTGDPGNPDYIWYINDVIETNSYIDDHGNIVDGDGHPINDPAYSGRIGVDSEGYVLLDGERLPLDRDIKLHDYVQYPNGTIVDKGFAGLLNAPGWYFSGYERVGYNASQHDVAENGDRYIYFFIPGNWINMQEVYNLETPDGERTWKVRTYTNVQPTPISVDIHSPNYPNRYPNNTDKQYVITQIDAHSIQLHFEDFNLEYNSRCRYDYVKIYKDSISRSNLLDTFCGNKGEFTTQYYTLGATKKLIIVFHSDRSVRRKGFKINYYNYISESQAQNGYKMQTRLDVVRDAMIDVIEATRGKINWALASFSINPTGNGAKIWQPFNPSLSDDEVRQNIITHLNQFTPQGGTPLGEALQDVWKHFHEKSSLLPACAKNFTIVLSDGYPSADNDWSRIDGVTFRDWDNDGWTEDPYQYSSPPPDYFDDVAHWMYTHSIVDKSEISDPSSSHKNIISHMLSFTLESPLMKDAAEEAGGIFLTAFNKEQLINAFYSLGLIIANSVSYIAPVVSVDTTNKTQSGNYIYMSFFKPKSPNWLGNLKKYKISYQQNPICPSREQKEWVILDKNGNVAVDCDGQFIDTSVSYWSINSDGGEVEAGGVGEVLNQKLKATSLTDPYSFRKIYFIDSTQNNQIKRFIPANIPDGMLDEANESEKYKIINYTYGYTYDEDGSSNHYPTGKRAWILGSIIHSKPAIVNYERDNKTYIIVGANDGMLHVFNDSTGEEIFALIPDTFLTKLKNLNPNSNIERPIFLLDGPLSFIYDFDSQGRIVPKYLIFGLRRGGRLYYCLDISSSNPEQWRVKWIITGGSGDFSELGYTWSKVKVAMIKLPSGNIKRIGIFSGGYDPLEDEYITPQTDVTMGRGIFIIDIDTGTKIYSYIYADNHNMKYCIPATPTVVTDENGYLKEIYFTDIGGQLWKTVYNSQTGQFTTIRIFYSNPGSDSTSGEVGGNLLTPSRDKYRKFFYSPAVTILGNCATLFSQGSINYFTKALYFGSGDREHPLNTTVNNRIYMVVDDNSSEIPYNETNLLNVTNDELDKDSGLSESAKNDILSKLHQAKGWFIKLGDIDDGKNHTGEKILSKPILYYQRAYFTSFLPVSSDPCNPHGIAREYALMYCFGIAGINFNTSNDIGNQEVLNKTDRYQEIGVSIPSSVTIGFRQGKAWGLISSGGGIIGAGKLGTPNIPQGALIIKVIRWENLLNF